MKILMLSIFVMIFSTTSWAATHYDILINEQGYDLKLILEFNDFQSIMNIRNALVKPQIISALSPTVKNITYTGTSDGYDLLMTVKSFGIKSDLLSKCKESATQTSWTRSCVLQTNTLDGGTYMVSKSDDVTCKKKNESTTICEFSIKGKTKPLTVLGFQILNERAFAVKAKYQALNNFFKLYYFIKDHNISTRWALEKFNTSEVKKELEDFESDAGKKLKTDLTYKRSFTLKELK